MARGRSAIIPSAALEFHRNPGGTLALDIWIHDARPLRGPVPPRFSITVRERVQENPPAGYGLVLSANLESGESIDYSFCAEKLSGLFLFEPWEKRLDPRK